MNVAGLYRKALRQAEFGRFDAAESTLREVLAGTKTGEVARVRALVVLGDLLCGVGRETEAMPLLESALREGSADDLDDLLDHELARARELLDGHRG
ncbi:MAG: hypothetical protein ABIQ18_42330 [Umezawaea sp.]